MSPHSTCDDNTQKKGCDDACDTVQDDHGCHTLIQGAYPEGVRDQPVLGLSPEPPESPPPPESVGTLKEDMGTMLMDG